MTRKKKSSIVKRQWIHQSRQYYQKNIVVTSQAHRALQELLKHLKATITHPFINSIEVKPYWLEMQLPLLLPYAKDRNNLSVSMKIFVARHNDKLNFLLVEQFLEDDFDVDMTHNYASYTPNMITLYLNDSFCLGLMFDEIEAFQDTLELLIMNCYEILFNPEDNQSSPLSFS